MTPTIAPIMKVSIAVVKLVLRTNKTLADGTHPIMLRVSFNGMKERSCGYSCPEKFWDKKNEMVKRGFPNYASINEHIQAIKAEVVALRNEYERLGKAYTPQMLLAPQVKQAKANDVTSLIERYISEKGLSYKTIERWNIVKRSLAEFHKGLVIEEINEAFCVRYAKHLEIKGVVSGTVRTYMSKVVALLHYAMQLKLITDYPLSSWSYTRKYRESKSELYIHYRTMEVLMKMLFDEVIIRNGSRWKYKEGAIDKLLDIHSELYALYLYCLGFYMKGLAPVDLSTLKKGDLKVVMLKNKSYYAIDGYREKTNMPYKIRLEQNSLEGNVYIRTMLMYNDGDYFLPTLKNFNGSNPKKKVNYVYYYHKDNLLKWFMRCNEVIAQHNASEDDDIPLIDLNCKFYSYRHSYLMQQIQKPNANLLRIATETGKSLSSLHQYLTYLNDEDLV